MDTIEIKLNLKKGLNIDLQLINQLRSYIDSITNNGNYRYCDVLQVSKNGDLIVKISYPRYFAKANAYLITRRSECFEVQTHFINSIFNDPTWASIIENITLGRVDIPFTYLMNNEEQFASYENIFYIFAFVYARKKENARTKAYLDLQNRNFETLIYSPNGSVGKSANNKLEVYNQALNLRNKLEEEVWNEVVSAHKDLPFRIRMEVSKRIRLRNNFSPVEFANLDILGMYFEDYKKYILENVLDFSIIEELYNYWAYELSQRLNQVRMNKGFTYGEFIYQNQTLIYDYEIVRRALGIAIENINTRENAITRVRKILVDYEKNNNIILMDTYGTLKRIESQIIGAYLLD